MGLNKGNIISVGDAEQAEAKLNKEVFGLVISELVIKKTDFRTPVSREHYKGLTLVKNIRGGKYLKGNKNALFVMYTDYLNKNIKSAYIFLPRTKHAAKSYSFRTFKKALEEFLEEFEPP